MTEMSLDNSRKVFVGDLSKFCHEDDLALAFQNCGKIQAVLVKRCPGSGKSLAYGFIEFSEEYEATNAICNMNGSVLMGRKIRVRNAVASKKDLGVVRESHPSATKATVHVRYFKRAPSNYVTEEDLHRAFDLFGNVEDIVIKQAEIDSSRLQRGYAFVEFTNNSAGMASALRALEVMNNASFEGISYTVQPSKSMALFLAGGASHNTPWAEDRLDDFPSTAYREPEVHPLHKATKVDRREKQAIASYRPAGSSSTSKNDAQLADMGGSYLPQSILLSSRCNGENHLRADFPAENTSEHLRTHGWCSSYQEKRLLQQRVPFERVQRNPHDVLHEEEAGADGHGYYSRREMHKPRAHMVVAPSVLSSQRSRDNIDSSRVVVLREAHDAMVNQYKMNTGHHQGRYSRPPPSHHASDGSYHDLDYQQVYHPSVSRMQPQDGSALNGSVTESTWLSSKTDSDSTSSDYPPNVCFPETAAPPISRVRSQHQARGSYPPRSFALGCGEEVVAHTGGWLPSGRNSTTITSGYMGTMETFSNQHMI